MINSIDNLTVLPIDKILPILAVEKIGDAAQALSSRANQFTIGQVYQAMVTGKTDDGKQLVEVDGKLLKMDLGTQVTKGQTLNLRFMQDSPTPTFYLLPNIKPSSDATADISPAGHLIGNIIQQAQEAGTPTRYEATAVVTQHPKDALQVSYDLKQAVQNSGLFYEAHLAEAVAGKRSIESMKLELQNVASSTNNASLNPAVNALPAQQLALLENQRLSWHGEVWQGQTMDWDVYVEQRQQNEQRRTPRDDIAPPIFSEMTLHLPNLGKVSARVGIIDGRVQVNLLTQEAQTLATFKQERQRLFAAMTENGQQVEALTVGQYA